jgi:hypothetical protein
MGAFGVSSYLIDARAEILSRFHDTYVAEMSPTLSAADATLPSWEALNALGRLAEGVTVDHDELMRMWTDRNSAPDKREEPGELERPVRLDQ